MVCYSQELSAKGIKTMNLTIDTPNPKEAKNVYVQGYRVDVSYPRNEVAIEEIQTELVSLTEEILPELPDEVKTHLTNQEKLEAIAIEGSNSCSQSLGAYAVAGLMAIILGTGYAALTLPLGYAAYKLLEKAQRLGHIEQLMKKLIEEFSEEGIEIFPRLNIEGLDYIDLFIRFPSKTFFVVSLQNIGDNTLFYSMHRARSSGKQRGGLYLKSSKGSSRTFRSKKLDLLPEQEKSIRKQYRDILGGTAKDARSGMNKIIAICGKEAKMTNNFPSELTEKHEGRKFYLAQKNPGIFIMRDEEITDFIKIKIQKKQF
jgi:hypothetical protein